MKIALAPIYSKNNDIANNLKEMEKKIKEASDNDVELILFGEASLHGFDALSFDYEDDIKNIALGLKSPVLVKLRELAIEYNIALGFGFYENDHSGIFDSYIIINEKGQEIVKYQRISQGWKPENACVEYREGNRFPRFTFKNKSFSIMICGDFWEDSLLDIIIQHDPFVSAYIWPVHLDITADEWQDEYHYNYKIRSEILAKPILFINNLHQREQSEQSAAYVWQQGRELAALEPGSSGILIYHLD